MVETVGRVFLAVPVPSEVRAALAAHVASLDIPGRLVPAENWHLTARFLGTVDELTYERFLGELAQADLPDAFPVRLGRIGGFPNSKRANVVWVGVERGDEEIAIINEIAEEAAQSVGLAAEDRPFHPHLSLSRVRPPRGVTHLLDEDVDLRWTATEVVVYHSHLRKGRARYGPLERLDLAR